MQAFAQEQATVQKQAPAQIQENLSSQQQIKEEKTRESLNFGNLSNAKEEIIKTSAKLFLYF